MSLTYRPQPARRHAEVEALERRALLVSAGPGFTAEILVRSLEFPTSMAFTPDGRVFIADQYGSLRLIKNLDAPAPSDTEFMRLRVDAEGERGLLGVAVDPEFTTNRHLYVYYTVARDQGGPFNRISRFTASTNNPDVVEPGSELPLIELDPLENFNHNGGAI